MKSHKNEYATDFPLDACPHKVQNAARLMNSHYGVPIGTGAAIGLTVALAAAGNRRTLSGDPAAPRSANLFSVIEVPPNSRAEEAIDWILGPIWHHHSQLQIAHIRSGQETIYRAMLGETDAPATGFSEKLAKLTLEFLNEEVVKAFPQIILDNIGCLPIWQDAMAHSFEHGILSTASHEVMGSLFAMARKERQELFSWLDKVWTGNASGPGNLPEQVVLLWQADPTSPLSTRHMLDREGQALPAFVVPWREGEALEARAGGGEPRDGAWDSWTEDLLIRRESENYTITDFAYRGLLHLDRLRCDLEATHPDHLEIVDRTVEATRSLALLMASVESMYKPDPLVTKDHVEKAALIANWLLNEHLGWLASLELVEVPLEFDSSEEKVIQALHYHDAVNPDALHRLISGHPVDIKKPGMHGAVKQCGGRATVH